MSTFPVALITGGAHRIGKALCQALHEKQFNIAIHFYQSEKASLALKEKLNRIRPKSAEIFQTDLTVPSELSALYNNVIGWQSTLMVLINNASLFLPDPSAAHHWDRLFNCNVKAPYLLSKLCSTALKKNKGCIINLTDLHAHKPLKDYTIYCMTKAALSAQTTSLAKEFAPEIRVNAIAPGAILWPENESELSVVLKNKIIQKTPSQRVGGTKPIIQAALHFIENTFVTGTSLTIDGGRHMNF